MLGHALVAHTVSVHRGAYGESVFTSPGTHSFTVPANVESVSVVCVGSGSKGFDFSSSYEGGGGGALAYTNNIPVSPGQVITVVVGSDAQTGPGLSDSRFGSFCIAGGGKNRSDDATPVIPGGSEVSVPGEVIVGDGGGAGGKGGFSAGGGAGGYAGKGGDAGLYARQNGQDGAGGGGGAGFDTDTGNDGGHGGGGVGLYGIGPSGEAGSLQGNHSGAGGSGATTLVDSANGGLYGGGASPKVNADPSAGHGAVRVVWPGALRVFPSSGVQEIVE